MARQSNTEKMIAERKKAEAERTDALNNAIFQIEKKFGKGSVMRLGDNEEKWFRFRAVKAKSYKNCGRRKFNYEWLCL